MNKVFTLFGYSYATGKPHGIGLLNMLAEKFYTLYKVKNQSMHWSVYEMGTGPIIVVSDDK